MTRSRVREQRVELQEPLAESATEVTLGIRLPAHLNEQYHKLSPADRWEFDRLLNVVTNCFHAQLVKLLAGVASGREGWADRKNMPKFHEAMMRANDMEDVANYAAFIRYHLIMGREMIKAMVPNKVEDSP